MIEGCVVNNSGRGCHIFKRPVSPGAKVPLADLYQMYAKNSNKYKGKFDEDFLDWLRKNKIPDGFDIVIDKVGAVEEAKPKVVPEKEKKSSPPKRVVFSSMTAKEISELKTKDNPKKVIQEILSKHKLRRALTLCKDRPGKGTLTRLIRVRISELP